MRYLYIIVCIAFSVSCVEPIEVELSDSKSNLLVVEGGITTSARSHIIQLTRTAKYGSIFEGVIKRETGASVSIRDSDGNVNFLSELGNGVYATDSNFAAVIGKSYSLQILTASGEEYNSIPEMVEPVQPISRVYTEFKEKASADPLQTISGVQVNIEYQDPKDEKNYYLWRLIGTYRINANPELNIDPESGQVVPLDCCATCWTTEVGNIPNLMSDVAFDGALIEMPLVFIEDDGVRFGGKYHLVIQQRSLSAEAYEFYSLVNEQISIDGDIFDPPPATVRGNMINLNEPDENVIGYFSASDEVTDSLFILPEELNYVKKSLIRGDCRNFKPNATVAPPEFWK